MSTNEAATVSQGGSPTAQTSTGNKYTIMSKASLEELRDNTIKWRLEPAEKGRVFLQNEIETLKQNFEKPDLTSKEKELADHERIIAEVTQELRLINEALATK